MVEKILTILGQVFFEKPPGKNQVYFLYSRLEAKGMKHASVRIGLFGLAFLLCACNFVWATPFGETDPVNIAPTTVKTQTDTTKVLVPVTPKAEDELASVTSTLWKELKKLYGTASGAIRIGRRSAQKTAASKTEHHLKGFDDLKIDIDGDNYCGQFAMSTLLNGMGIKTDPNEIYKDTNPAGIFTAPPTIVETLRQRGIDARMKNEASVNDIKTRIDNGKPVMVLVDSGDGTPHWVCIYGYDTDQNGTITSVRMRDSYWGTSGPHTMDIKDFTKAWKSPFGGGTLGKFANYSNLLIDNLGKIDPKTPLYPGNFSTATIDNMASGINDVVTGYKNGSLPKMLSGATKLVVGLPGAITGAASNYLDKASQGWMNWGANKMSQGGVGNQILGGAAVVGGALSNGVAKTGQVISNVWSSGASTIGNGIKKIGSWFS